MHVESTSRTKAPPRLAGDIALSPDGIRRTLTGGARGLQADAAWPAIGSHMSWRAGGRFKATVVENALPDRIVMEVATPAGRSRMTHTFVAAPDGMTHITTSLDVEPEGVMRAIAPAWRFVLERIVEREARMAAKIADEAVDRGSSSWRPDA